MNLGVTAQKIDTICLETERYREVVSSSKQVPVLKERIVILNLRLGDKDSAIARLESAARKDEAAYKELQFQNHELKEQKELVLVDNEVKKETINRLERNLKFQKTIRNGLLLVLAGAAVKMFIIK